MTKGLFVHDCKPVYSERQFGAVPSKDVFPVLTELVKVCLTSANNEITLKPTQVLIYSCCSLIVPSQIVDASGYSGDPIG